MCHPSSPRSGIAGETRERWKRRASALRQGASREWPLGLGFSAMYHSSRHFGWSGITILNRELSAGTHNLSSFYEKRSKVQGVFANRLRTVFYSCSVAHKGDTNFPATPSEDVLWRMNELAGVALQPSQTPFCFLFGKAFVLCLRLQPRSAKAHSSKQTPSRNSAQTAVSSLRASAILATWGLLYKSDGQNSEAIPLCAEATKIYKQLAVDDPDRYGPASKHLCTV